MREIERKKGSAREGEGEMRGGFLQVVFHIFRAGLT